METTEKVQGNLAEMVTISRAEYERYQTRISELESRVEMLMEALRLARHKRFGASSKKSEEPPHAGQSSFGHFQNIQRSKI